jgi:hypothetical protein
LYIPASLTSWNKGW